jgi:hypothetical protein
VLATTAEDQEHRAGKKEWDRMHDGRFKNGRETETEAFGFSR